MLCKCWCSMWTTAKKKKKKKKRWKNSDNSWRHHSPTSSPWRWRWLGRWTRPETPLQPLPAPGGPCTLSAHPAAAPFKKVPRSGWEPRSASSSAAELNSQEAGKGLQESTPHFWEKRLWDPTFFFVFFCPQRGFFFFFWTRGSNFCGDKRGKFCASCVTLASVLQNNLRVPLCSSCVPLLLQLLWRSSLCG